MTEILEYALVALVSSIFVAGSVGAYGAFSSFESNLQLRTTFASVSDLASSASLHGTSMASLEFPPSSTLSCSEGTLSLTTGPSVLAGSIPLNCQFAINLSAGNHKVTFSVHDNTLFAVVK
jgi:NO-binding membrane sensor protein with MHYT domain